MGSGQTSTSFTSTTTGRPCDTAALEGIAARHRLKLMYDAAHAFGCSHAGRMIGGFGSCEILSFHATKFLNSFEGGAVVTNDDALADQMRLMRNFGFVDYDRVIYVGTNGKMTEICAAMGLTSLEAMDDIIAINKRNYEAYRRGLSGLPGVSVINHDDSERSNYQYVPAEVAPGSAPLTRDELIAVLHAENVLARSTSGPGAIKWNRTDRCNLTPACCCPRPSGLRRADHGAADRPGRLR